MSCLQSFTTEEILSNYKKHRFLKRINSYEGENTIKYQEHIPNSIGRKLVCIDDRFTLPSIIFEGKDCINKFITWVIDK